VKSKIIKNTLNPTWDEQFTFDINTKEGSDAYASVCCSCSCLLFKSLTEILHRPILFTLYDWDAIGKDDFLGYLKVPLEDILTAEKYTLEGEFPLDKETKEKKKGKPKYFVPKLLLEFQLI
jgi:Ca2+-dependent lipid-binding protein